MILPQGGKINNWENTLTKIVMWYYHKKGKNNWEKQTYQSCSVILPQGGKINNWEKQTYQSCNVILSQGGKIKNWESTLTKTVMWYYHKEGK